jgi:hypothetical protein
MNRGEMLARLEAGEDPLELSIEKWQNIVDGTAVDDGAFNCALCEKYYRERHGFSSALFCTKCPVQLKTKRPFCNQTPYRDYVYAIDAGKTTQEQHEAAVAELAFLKSLRPKAKP